MSELWSRLGFLAFALIIYRLGTHIPIPGINPEQVAALFKPRNNFAVFQFVFRWST
jgi:preprotein translocase subunit SecY